MESSCSPLSLESTSSQKINIIWPCSLHYGELMFAYLAGGVNQFFKNQHHSALFSLHYRELMFAYLAGVNQFSKINIIWPCSLHYGELMFAYLAGVNQFSKKSFPVEWTTSKSSHSAILSFLGSFSSSISVEQTTSKSPHSAVLSFLWGVSVLFSSSSLLV